MKPRKILIFSLVYYPNNIGGAEVAVKEITDRIAPNDVEFEMITLLSGKEKIIEQVGNVKVYRLFNKVGFIQKFLYPFAACSKAIKLHHENHYDAVWAIMASYAGFAAYLFQRKNSATPFILTVQEGDHFERRSGILKPLFRKIFSNATRIQVISEFLANWSSQMGAICPIDIVPNGVDLENFSRPVGADKIREIKSRFGFKDNDTILITASRLVEKNAVDDIISALQYLDSSTKLLILGIGPDEEKLRNLVNKMKLENRVIFGGFAKHEDLPSFLQAADIFIRPSRTEGLGNSFIEAMAAGIPVIGTQVGGIPDFLKDGETGLFCEVNNPQSIAQKVGKLLKDSESRDYIVRQAREMVKNKYGWEKVAKAMRDILI